MGNAHHKDNPLETPNISESPSMIAHSGIRLSVRKKGKYHGNDPVDTYLLNQIAKHVRIERLGTLARDLNIEKSVYSLIENQEDKI